MPMYDSSERDGKYITIQTNPEDDALHIHTDGGISGENSEPTIIRRSKRRKKRIDTTVYLIQETSVAKNRRQKIIFNRR